MKISIRWRTLSSLMFVLGLASPEAIDAVSMQRED